MSIRPSARPRYFVSVSCTFDSPSLTFRSTGNETTVDGGLSDEVSRRVERRRAEGTAEHCPAGKALGAEDPSRALVVALAPGHVGDPHCGSPQCPLRTRCIARVVCSSPTVWMPHSKNDRDPGSRAAWMVGEKRRSSRWPVRRHLRDAPRGRCNCWQIVWSRCAWSRASPTRRFG